ncbi:MAG TPA: hypothetical protein VKU41_29575, partial [Polyangiaceae bacterium]|nr:hypothetical protein [Polyangiaceae bacterium]
VPLSRREIETADAYPDKALFVSEGTRSGVYMPEAFNVLSGRIVRLQAVARSVAREKAGLSDLGPRSRVEVCEVTEFVESADRSHAIRLDGPVASVDAAARGRVHAAAAGRAACAWLAAIQAEDGSLPVFVRPASGKGEGSDVVRGAMTAEALAAFGSTCGLESAVETARRMLRWLHRTRPQWIQKRGVALPATIYAGKAAGLLGDEAAVNAAATNVLAHLEEPEHPPLVLAHALSFLDGTAARHAPASRRRDALRLELAGRFARAMQGEAPVSLAEWAELGAVSPLGSGTAREVRDWLRSRQLSSGAFPESTTSDFAYSRGTGKVFEVLALRPSESPGAIDGALGWLLSMQYRPDSSFFVPHEHWGRVLGGLRHDAYGADAWIDAAGHFLLGLARLHRDDA